MGKKKTSITAYIEKLRINTYYGVHHMQVGQESSLNLSFMEDIPVFGYFFSTKSRRITQTRHSCTLKSVCSQTARKRRRREDGVDYEVEEMQRQNHVERAEERKWGWRERFYTDTVTLLTLDILSSFSQIFN